MYLDLKNRSFTLCYFNSGKIIRGFMIGTATFLNGYLTAAQKNSCISHGTGSGNAWSNNDDIQRTAWKSIGRAESCYRRYVKIAN